MRTKEANVTEGVTFEHANVLIRDFQEGEFDVIYSRDCIIHIREKAALFERFFRWLKPGGRLVISGEYIFLVFGNFLVFSVFLVVSVFLVFLTISVFSLFFNIFGIFVVSAFSVFLVFLVFSVFSII